MRDRRLLSKVSQGVIVLAVVLAACAAPTRTQLNQTVSARGQAIHFQAGGEALKDAKLKSRGNILGFVGDFVELENGSYNISMEAPNQYTLEFTLQVNGGRISVSDTNTYPANCEPELRTRWPSPRVVRSRDYRDLTIVRIEDPIFGAPTSDFVQCVQYSMATCTKRKIILTAKSEPVGAEIWIDGEKQRFRTNNILSVPYCAAEEDKSILVRMEDRMNCEEFVDLSPDARVTIDCALREPIPVSN